MLQNQNTFTMQGGQTQSLRGIGIERVLHAFKARKALKLMRGVGEKHQDSITSSLASGNWLSEERAYLLLKSGKVTSFNSQNLLASRVHRPHHAASIMSENPKLDPFTYRALACLLDEKGAYEFMLAQISKANGSVFYPHSNLQPRHSGAISTNSLVKQTMDEKVMPVLSKIRSNDLLLDVASSAMAACANPYVRAFFEHIVDKSIGIMFGQNRKADAWEHVHNIRVNLPKIADGIIV